MHYGISNAPENWVLRHLDPPTTNGGANNRPLFTGDATKQEDGNTVISEMQTFHLDFYNDEHDQTSSYAVMLDKWDNQGLLTTMKNRVGYRLNLVSATASGSMAPGENSTVKFTMPSSAVAGTYDIFLALPDEYASLASNSAYSVRIASRHNGSDVWSAELGANWVGTTMVGATGSATGTVRQSGGSFAIKVDHKGALSINLSSTDPTRIQIADLSGRLVYAASTVSSLLLPASTLKPGVYFISQRQRGRMSAVKMTIP